MLLGAKELKVAKKIFFRYPMIFPKDVFLDF
jgi:hypothetical protein